MKIDYYILKGRRVVKTKNVLVWAKFFESKERVLKQENLPNGYWISTVFTGIGWERFQTMVFLPIFAGTRVGNKDYNLRETADQERYNTYKEAEEGHEKLAEKWRKKLTKKKKTN